jgi:hypothetical protein
VILTAPELISQPGEVSSDWLTRVLQDAGIDAEVTEFTATSIGTGQVGDNVRFALTGRGDLPPTIVGKFASPDPVSRQTGIDTLNYRREVHFYRHLQKKVSIQTPKILFTDVDHQSHEFVIVMEDLSPGIQGDQLGGCDADLAELAMVQLAHLHGPVWGDTGLTDDELITDNTADKGEQIKLMYDALAPGFIDRYNNRLSPHEIEMVGLVGENLIRYVSNYPGDLTLIHIDYRLDNMMFGGPYPLAVVDWQSPALGCALNDTAYFMGTSIKEDRRSSVEESLVKTYFETLSAYEVSLTWENCWHYYRHYAPAGLIMAVIASMIVGETQRGNDMFMVMAKRSAHMCRELESIEAIKARPNR